LNKTKGIGKDMQNQSNELLWSDKWCVEDNKAWLVPGNYNILFCVDMLRNRYTIITALPNYFYSEFRQNSNCIKCGNTIFCMPNTADCIWCYDLNTVDFQKIVLVNPDNVRLMMIDFWKCENLLWVVSMGLKQIIEIDIKKKEVIDYYNITDQEDEAIARSVKWDKNIYSVSGSKGRIYVFNIETKKVKVKEFPVVKNGLRTISVEGGKIWLSGYKREIYVWDEDENDINTLSLPCNFGIYNFDGKQEQFLDCKTTEYDTAAFLESINVGNYIWFIPFQTNQILYVNKDTNQINTFEIEEEEEDEKSIKNREMNCKYLLQYVYDDRYIGLYSFKNKVVYEVDAYTMKLKTRIVTLNIGDSTIIPKSWILQESKDVERALFRKLIELNGENILKKEKIGMKVYNYLQ
jgi:hypothetical protein